MHTLIDTHCHLTSERFAADLDGVIARAADAGVARMISIGTGIADTRLVAGLMRAHPGVIHGAAGLDPFAAKEASPAFADHLAELGSLLTGGFSALGEIGLEYHHDLAPAAMQVDWLERQLDLAVRLDLPVVIHARSGKAPAGDGGDAHAQMAAILARHCRVRGVIHSFDGPPAAARAYLDLGFLLSINGMVTFKPNDALRESARLIPNDRLVVETDAPYLAPVPLRGQRCEPMHVVRTAAFIADLRGQREEDIAGWTTRNACRLFAIDAEPPIRP